MLIDLIVKKIDVANNYRKPKDIGLFKIHSIVFKGNLIIIKKNQYVRVLYEFLDAFIMERKTN